MKFIQALAATSLAISASHALTVIKPRGAPKVVQHDIRRKDVADPVARDKLRRRASTVSASLQNDQTLYLMEVSIGTPAQTLNLHLDTGSSDLWVNVPNSELCQSRDGDCSISGTYSANSSSTYKYVNSLFNISYADGSGSAGDYATDVVSFGGVSISNQEFGIGYESSSSEGIIGIGYELNEAILQFGGKQYSNVPASLQSSGLINTVAYSLWLNDLESSSGSILFGGIDSSKFTAPLTTVPIIKEYGLYQQFVIALTGVGYNGNSGSIASNQAVGVLLDSGSSLLYLPDSWVNTIYTLTGAVYSDEAGAGIINCNQQTNTTTIDFTFSGATIRVPLSEMVVLVESTGRSQTCILGVGPSGGDQAVLGDTFLRSAYVVYDLTNNEISLAQTNFNGGSSNVLEITSTVPSAAAATNAVSTVAAQQTGGRINGGSITVTGASSTAMAAPTALAAGAAALFGAMGAGLMVVL